MTDEPQESELPDHLRRLADVAASLIAMAAVEKNNPELNRQLIEESRRRMSKWMPDA